MTTLYGISADLLALEELLDEQGESGTVDDATITRWLDELGSLTDAKADGYCCLVRELEARALTRKAEAHRLRELQKIDEHKAERLREALRFFMEAHGIKRIDAVHFRITLAAGGKGAVVLDVRPEALPDSLVRVRREPDLDRIRAEVEMVAPATHPLAHIAAPKSSLRIK